MRKFYPYNTTELHRKRAQERLILKDWAYIMDNLKGSVKQSVGNVKVSKEQCKCAPNTIKNIYRLNYG